MGRVFRNLAIALLVVAVAGAGGVVWFLKSRAPTSIDRPPVLANVPSLPEVTRSSLIVTPVVVPLAVIRTAIETAIPTLWSE